MTSGLPTITVKLDDGTGTYPTDVTSLVRMGDGIGLAGFGRSDEFTTTAPSTLSLVLDNTDGRFTNGTVTLAPGTGVRWSVTSGATSRDYFTGRVESLDLSWPSGGQPYATVAVTAVDFLGDLSRRVMRSMVEEELLTDAPTALYTFAEPEGSTSAGDTGGKGFPSLNITGTGAAMTFGAGTGPTDGLTCATFAGGKFLRGTGATWVPASTAFTLECYFSTTLAPAAQAVIVNLDDGTAIFADFSAYLAITPAGRLTAVVQGSTLISPPPAVNDGLVHHAAVTLTSGGVMTLYLDGVNVGSVGSVTVSAVPASRFAVAANDTPIISTPFVGTVAHATVYPAALSAARLASHADVLTDFAETTDARLSRLASYAGMTATTVTASGQTMVLQDTTGQSLADAMQTVATAEGGVLFVDGSGVLTMQGRYYRSVRTTPDLVLKSDAIDPGTDVTWDTQQKINQVTVTRTGGTTQAVSAADVLANRNTPVYGQSLDLAVPTDAEALDAANWALTKHQDTAPRLASVTLDLMAPDPSTTAAAMLALDLGDRISLTPMPSQLWAGAGDYTIEGWSVTLSDVEWTHALNVLPWQLAQAWILGDAVYGVLGSTTILGY